MFEVIYLLTYFLWKIRPLFPLLSLFRPLLSQVWNLVTYQGVYIDLKSTNERNRPFENALVPCRSVEDPPSLQRSLFYISTWPAATRPVPIALGKRWKVARWNTRNLLENFQKPKGCHLHFKHCYLSFSFFFFYRNVNQKHYFSLFTIIANMGQEKWSETRL